tara:strand:+ start:236044 stop:236508 length:465 start_codon:yes stop_codon:yes gene_type:complete
VIGTANYREATEVIAEAQELGDLAFAGLLCMRDRLFEGKINPRDRFRRELYANMNATYSLIANRHIRANQSMIQFVKALNDHILVQYGNEYGYETLDEFLVDQYLQVPTTFASISAFIGYSITEIGDKAANWEDIDDNWEDVDLNWDRIGWENV